MHTRKHKAQEHREQLKTCARHLHKSGSKSEEDRQNWDANVTCLERALESEQKYRQLLLKDSAELLKDLDRQHLKGVTALKHLLARVEELKRIRASRFEKKEI